MASDHYTPNGGRNSSGQGWQYSSNSNPNGRGTPPKKNNDGVSWAAIVMFFILGTFTGVFYVPAVILLVKKLTSMSKQDKERFRQEVNTTANTVRSEVRSSVTKTRTAGAGKGKQASAPSHSYDPEVNAKQKREKKPGLGLIIAGAIVAGIFAIPLPVVASEFLSSLFHGYFFADELSGLLVLLLFFCGGLGMLFSGVSSRRAQERYLGYLGYIGANREVNLAHMAAAFDVPVKKLCKDLRKMLAKGILPTGYLDLASGKLFLTEMGAKAPEPEKTAQTEANQDARTENDILWEIRQVNDQIPDEVMTAKIRRIEEITAKILAYQKTHPNRDSQLRSFLNYYLPTTLKILRAYAQLDAQGIEGENISAAKARIEGMMDQVVAGFEKQLDKLFHDDAMDISSDVQVLENMLKKDGLSEDGDGMTMTL